MPLSVTGVASGTEESTGGGYDGVGGGNRPSAQITTWATSNLTARTVGGTTLYDPTSD